ncbi:hypothetical protein C2S52_007886 [Perilla frutescens var. hirtella]|nr:hypothetical protein C2S52_007886 [Perilla frutescens var. hirtella]
MHSGFEIPGLHHQPPPENSCPPLLLSMNPTHILDQIHDHHHHFLPPHHHYAAAAAPYFPLLNFKLGLNDFKDPAAVSGGDALLRGSEHFELPEVRQSSLGMLHAPFWEPLPAEVSNENSEIMKRQELNQKETLRNCLDAKSRLHFSELDAIYKRLGNAETTQTPPNQTLTPAHLPTVGTFESDRHHAPDNIEGDVSGSGLSLKKRKTKRKKKTSTGTDTSSCIVVPMAEFFENLVNQVMDHQENLQRKFTEVMDRLNEERREREEAWRNQELAQFEREAAARAHDKAMAKSREAMIVSYLEKITGRRINLPALTTSEITNTNTTGDSNCGGEDEEMELKQQQPPTAYY